VANKNWIKPVVVVVVVYLENGH